MEPWRSPAKGGGRTPQLFLVDVGEEDMVGVVEVMVQNDPLLHLIFN